MNIQQASEADLQISLGWEAVQT